MPMLIPLGLNLFLMHSNPTIALPALTSVSRCEISTFTVNATAIQRSTSTRPPESDHFKHIFVLSVLGEACAAADQL